MARRRPVTVPRVPRVATLLAGHREIIVITVTGFALRVLWLAVAQPMPISDWYYYKSLALDLIDHGQFGYPERTAFYLPGLSVFLALWALVSRSDAWLSMGTIVLGTATIPLLFATVRRILKERGAALIAAGLFAALPAFVLFSPVLATEHLFVLLVLVAILILVRRRGDIAMATAALAGFVLALATLTRGEGLFYVPALILFITFGDREATMRGSARAATVFILAFLAGLAPWYIRNISVADAETGLSTGAAVNFYYAHNDSGVYGWYPGSGPLETVDPDQRDDLAWELAFDYLRPNPLRLFANVPIGTHHLLSPPDYAVFWSTHYVPGDGNPNDPELFVQRDLAGLRTLEVTVSVAATALLVLAAAATLAFRRWTREMATLVLPLIGTVWFLRTVVYWAKPRYRYFADVMFVLLAAFTIWILAKGAAGQDGDPSRVRNSSEGD